MTECGSSGTRESARPPSVHNANLLQGRGVALRSLSNVIDPATNSVHPILNMLATLADYQRQLITERVNASMPPSKQMGPRSERR
ncbi:recombinase family protein [Paenarthrobacter sp. TA1.8]|uniref:recombinase family protein n=1 Tax=Paenarthrobacter sp. TA1.8 TaxID=3400219 RepID=UPI003B42AEE6